MYAVNIVRYERMIKGEDKQEIKLPSLKAADSDNVKKVT